MLSTYTESRAINPLQICTRDQIRIWRYYMPASGVTVKHTSNIVLSSIVFTGYSYRYLVETIWLWRLNYTKRMVATLPQFCTLWSNYIWIYALWMQWYLTCIYIICPVPRCIYNQTDYIWVRNIVYTIIALFVWWHVNADEISICCIHISSWIDCII